MLNAALGVARGPTSPTPWAGPSTVVCDFCYGQKLNIRLWLGQSLEISR